MSEFVKRRGIVIALAVFVLSSAFLWAWFASKANGSVNERSAPMRAANAPAVMVQVPEIKRFAQEVEALGTVRANESVDITAKVSDRIAAIHFQEGQQVRKGQLLVELDNTEARADLAAAQAAFGDSQSQYKRSQELYETRALSQAQLEQLQATLLANEARVAAAQSRLNDRLIQAPFAGRVGLRNVSLGSLVNPGQVITTLDDLSVVKLDFSVPEVFLSALQAKLPITALSSAYPDREFTGQVLSIGTRVDPATRSIAIRAEIDNRQGHLRPGMFMNVKLVRAERDALMLPERAIVPEDDRHFVYVVEDDKALKRAVTVGRRRPGEVEILEGVSLSDRVIVDGTLNLREGVSVRPQMVADSGAPT